MLCFWQPVCCKQQKKCTFHKHLLSSHVAARMALKLMWSIMIVEASHSGNSLSVTFVKVTSKKKRKKKLRVQQPCVK